MIAAFAGLIPTALLQLSGRVFYSGRVAFNPATAAPIYVLGLNPGGDPDLPDDLTPAHRRTAVAQDTARVLGDGCPSNWSAYRDETWGTGLRPNVLHLFAGLGLDPGTVPSSNLIFKRSEDEASLADKRALADLCWPFHAAVIAELRPRAVLCFGRMVGAYVCARLGAQTEHGIYTETNKRGYKSWAHRTADDALRIITATHPSHFQWRFPTSDITPLVREALA